MIEAMVEWAGQAQTAWWVLAGAAVIIVIGAFRASETVFWGDLLEDDDQ